MPEPWQTRAQAKRSQLTTSIPPEWTLPAHLLKDKPSSVQDLPKKSNLLTPSELALTETSAVDLAARIRRGELKSMDVTRAVCKRAAIAQQAVNCAAEFFPEMALLRARQLDEYFEKTGGKVVGPLHGVPVSLKDQLRVKDLETSMGYVTWLGNPETASSESILTRLLRNAGAVFYIKTTVPQGLMFCETFNNVTGRTVNPFNTGWSCGGSSGGEGALLGMRGGVLGVGTDIGGSIRVPAAFNNLYGIRTSHGRLPYAKMANSNEGQETVHSVVGPMGHSAPDLRLFLTSILDEQPWKYDPKVVPMPWRFDEEEAVKAKSTSGGLTLGFYNCDGNVLPHPPILRGIETVVSALKQNGHTVVPWTPYKHDYATQLVGRIYDADGGADVRRVTEASGEPVVPQLTDFCDPSNKKIDINESWDVQLQKWHYQTEYLEKWREAEEQLGRELDAIIAPVAATAAVRHDKFEYYGYTNVINLLDFTSVVVPVSFADKSVDAKDQAYKPRNEVDASVQAEYDAEVYDGAPVAVQVIGRRMSEERTLAIAEEIGRLIGDRTDV